MVAAEGYTVPLNEDLDADSFAQLLQSSALSLSLFLSGQLVNERQRFHLWCAVYGYYYKTVSKPVQILKLLTSVVHISLHEKKNAFV